MWRLKRRRTRWLLFFLSVALVMCVRKLICHFVPYYCARVLVLKTTQSKFVKRISVNGEPVKKISTVDDYSVHTAQHSAYTGYDVHKTNLHFLPNFKSPCWLEEFTGKDVYLNNKIILSRKAFVHPVPVYRMRFIPHKGVGVVVNSGKGQSPAMCRLRCLPYFMVLGVAKSGTTDLYNRMKFHPEVYGPATKELFWWNRLRFSPVWATLGDFADFFDNATNNLINSNTDNSTDKIYYESAIGEFTSFTFMDSAFWRNDTRNTNLTEPKYTVADDIRAVTPNVKLIVILRNPTARLYSSYNMFVPRNRRSPEDFHHRIVGSISWWETCVKKLSEHSCLYGSPPGMPPGDYVLNGFAYSWRKNYTGLIRNGMYGLFAEEWLKIFPKESMLFIRTEDYRSNEAGILNDVVFPFLELKRVTDSGILKRLHNTSIEQKGNYYTGAMLMKTKTLLDKFYKPFNRKLAKLLGSEKWLWKDA